MLETTNQTLENSPHSAATRGFGQGFGLHPIPAGATLIVNAMIFGGDIVSLGMLFPLAFAAAVVLGVITFKSQTRFYGDHQEVALIKALVVGLLTAIPVGLPGFLTVPSAVVGFVHNLGRKSNHDQPEER